MITKGKIVFINSLEYSREIVCGHWGSKGYVSIVHLTWP